MAKERKSKYSLVQGNILWAILLFALPIALGNLLSVVGAWGDGYLISRHVGKEAFSGMGVGGALISFGAIFATAFPVGMSNLSSRYHIEGNAEKIRRNFASSLLLSLLAALFVVVATLALIEPLLPALKLASDSPLYGYARSFAYVASFSFFGTTLFSFLISYLRSIGEKKMPFVLIAVDVGFILLLDFLLVAVAGFGVIGIAISGIVAPLLSDLIGFLYLYVYHPELRVGRGDWALSWSESKKQLQLSLPLALELVVIALGGFAIQAAVDGIGEDAIYALSALGKLTSLLGLFSNGLNNAIAPFIAQNLANGEEDRAKRGLFIEIGLCLVCSLIDAAVLLLAYRSVIGLFLGEVSPSVLSYARKAMLFTLLIYALAPLYGTFRYVLGAIGHPLGNMVAGFLQLISQLVLVFSFVALWGDDAILGANALSEILPSLWVCFEVTYLFLLPPSFAQTMKQFPRR